MERNGVKMDITYLEAINFAKQLLLEHYKINIDDYSIGELSDMMNLLSFALNAHKDRIG